MILFGVDQSLSGTGITILENDRENEFWEANKIVHQEEIRTKTTGPQRLIFIRNRIRELIEEYKPDVIAREDYAMGAVGKVFNLGELGGVVDITVRELSKPLYVIPIQAWKKLLFKKGNIAKDTSYLLKFKQVTEYEFETDNIADSYGIANALHWYLAIESDPEFVYNLEEYMQEVFFDVKKAKKAKLTFKKAKKEKLLHTFLVNHRTT